jgi:hypothetical protein
LQGLFGFFVSYAPPVGGKNEDRTALNEAANFGDRARRHVPSQGVFDDLRRGHPREFRQFVCSGSRES